MERKDNSDSEILNMPRQLIVMRQQIKNKLRNKNKDVCQHCKKSIDVGQTYWGGKSGHAKMLIYHEMCLKWI